MGIKSILSKRSALRSKNDQVTNAAQLTLRQSLWPLTIVTLLFFLWGFAYGLLDTLNKHFQNTLGITRTRSSGLQAAYFGAYPLASLGYANWMLRALCMWPAGLNRSFGGFCGATFVIGSGLGSLETAANPYLAVCGPPKYAELRINFAQAFNAIGTVVGPVLGSYAFFTTASDDLAALRRVQWVYLAIGIFVFLLAGVFFISNIPEVTDADMEFQVAETHIEGNEKPFWKRYQLFHAAAAQFFYCGGQVAIASFFINYAVETRPGTSNSTGANFLAGAQGAFAVGRFSGTFLMKFVRPRWVFLVYLTGVIIFLAASTTQGGDKGVAMLFLVLFFESVCFPTIVALGIRGLGKHYKRGSGWIVGGVCGGAAIPPLLGHVADLRGNTGFAMVVPTVVMVIAWSYALAVNFVPSYRDPADKIGDSGIGIVTEKSDEEKGPEVNKEVQ
ncbi:hypothetical protein FQN50_001409 [Emmonsiellopsis sp. PD_5]|nr:hypothetical protein FQN50_001409 [Emmonsiellopsis sp. PD_5]